MAVNAIRMDMKYMLFDSVEAMLAPKTLSVLTGCSVSSIRCALIGEHGGTSLNRFERVTTIQRTGEERHYILKRIHFETDWFMNVTGDVRCRSVMLWQYGVLDELASHIDHTVIACCRDETGWAMLMNDVSAGLLALVPARYQIQAWLDALAFMHAVGWGNDHLKSDRYGLLDNAGLIAMTGVAAAQKYAHLPGLLPVWILEGWNRMHTKLAPDALEIFRSLMLNPQPLYNALAGYPATLAHGDYRAGANLAYMTGQPVPACAFDWQHAGYALMTVDLVWFINRARIRCVMPYQEATAYYRERLEHYLGFQFETARWQAMLDLGFLADVLRMACFDAAFIDQDTTAEFSQYNANLFAEFDHHLRVGVRWL